MRRIGPIMGEEEMVKRRGSMQGEETRAKE